MRAEDIYQRLSMPEVIKTTKKKLHHAENKDLMQKNTINLATVYRVLTQFEAAGLVVRHHFEGGNPFLSLMIKGIMNIWCVYHVGMYKIFLMKKLNHRNVTLQNNMIFY